MTRRLAALLLAVLALGVASAGPASAGSEPTTHVVCVGGSADPDGPFDGVCVWAPLPF